jgi:hypothetical protein
LKDCARDLCGSAVDGCWGELGGMSSLWSLEVASPELSYDSCGEGSRVVSDDDGPRDDCRGSRAGSDDDGLGSRGLSEIHHSRGLWQCNVLAIIWYRVAHP